MEYILIIIILFFIICYYINESFTDPKNNWIVLLTMCVNPNQLDKDPSKNVNEISNYRKELYTNVINNWLNKTSLPIYVVESSGYNFDDIKNERLVVFSFNGEPQPNSTVAEAKSILYALEQLKNYDINYTHILKVTGKYYLDDIESTLNILPPDYDIYTQQHCNQEWGQQNTEYYGIKKDLFFEFANTCGYNMESHMFHFMKNKKSAQFPITFSNNIARNAGDIITNL